MSVGLTEKNKRNLRLVISALIIFAGLVSAILSYNGILMYSNNAIVSLSIAIIVQAVVIVLVLTFPYAKGFLIPIQLLAYLIVAGLSTFTAYIYIYNSKEGPYLYKAEDIEITATVSTYLAKTLRYERKELENLKKDILKLKNKMNNEERNGSNGARKPGRGPFWYELQEATIKKENNYRNVSSFYNQLENQAKEIEIFMRDISKERMKIKSENVLTEAITGLFIPTSSQIKLSFGHGEIVRKIQAYKFRLNSYKAKQESSEKIFNLMVKKKDPVASAIQSVEAQKWKDNKVFAYVIYSGIFDFASFVLGYILLVLKGGNLSINKTISAGIEIFFSIPTTIIEAIIRNYHIIKSTPKRVNDQMENEERERGAYQQKEVWTLMAGIFAASEAIMQDYKGDIQRPINELFRLLEPLELTHGKQAIGILNSSLSQQESLKTLVSVLVLENVLIKEDNIEGFKLNKDNHIGYRVWLMLIIDKSRAKENMLQIGSPEFTGTVSSISIDTH